jgi:hypothetical protein
MKFTVLLIVGLAATGCGIGSSPLAPAFDGCTSSWSGGGLGPTVSGFTLSAQGAASRYWLSLKDIIEGETTDFAVVLEPPRIEYACGKSEQLNKFEYLRWDWNSMTTGPIVQEFGVLAPPSYVPVAVTIASCQCSLFGGPEWKHNNTNRASGHWEQRAWLTASQTVTFRVTGIGAGSTRITLYAHTGKPTGGVDGSSAASGAVAIRVVR